MEYTAKFSSNRHEIQRNTARSAAEVVRALIHRRHEEIFRQEGPDWLAAAETLAELSRKLKALARA